MKRIIIMLLIACSAITTVNAQSKATAKASQNKPTNVIKSLEFIAHLYGKKEGQTYAVTLKKNDDNYFQFEVTFGTDTNLMFVVEN